MKNILLFEKYLDSYYAPLYHAKSRELGLDTFKHDIIKGNIFGGDGKSFDYRKGKHYTKNHHGKTYITGISLTRKKDLRFNPKAESVSDIQFTFDTQKLRNKFRIIPFDYYGKDIKYPDGTVMQSPHKKNEWEELLVGDITEAHKYITNIEFNSDTVPQFFVESQKIDFFWSVAKYLEKYPHITVSSVNYFGRDNDKITKEFFFTWMDKIKVGDFKDIPLKKVA